MYRLYVITVDTLDLIRTHFNSDECEIHYTFHISVNP